MKNLLKSFLLTGCLLAAAMPVMARQTMVMVSGDEMEIEIVTMGTNEISYKKSSNPNGPTYTVARDKVFYIVMDNGEKEIITPLDATTPTSTTQYSSGGTTPRNNTLVGSIASSLADPTLLTDTIVPKKYYDHIAFYPRASVGYQYTGCDYDSYTLDWGGLAWSVDLNVLIPSGNESAWTIGTGICGLGGKAYLKNKKNKAEIGDMEALYWTIPFEWFYKFGDWFTLGFGDRPEILISQKSDGKKIKDTFTVFRDSFYIDGIVTVGNFDMGAQILLNLTRAFKGDDLSLSPTIGVSFVAGFRF